MLVDFLIDVDICARKNVKDRTFLFGTQIFFFTSCLLSVSTREIFYDQLQISSSQLHCVSCC